MDHPDIPARFNVMELSFTGNWQLATGNFCSDTLFRLKGMKWLSVIGSQFSVKEESPSAMSTNNR